MCVCVCVCVGVVAPNKGSIYGLNSTKLWFLNFTVFCI